MADPTIREFFAKYSWFLPACIALGLFVIILERKISEFRRKARMKK